MPYRVGPHEFDTIRLDPDSEILRLRIHDRGPTECGEECAPGVHWLYKRDRETVSELEIHDALTEVRERGTVTIPLPDGQEVPAPDIARYLRWLGADRPYLAVDLPDQFIVQLHEELEWFPLAYLMAGEFHRRPDGSYVGPRGGNHGDLHLRCVAIRPPHWGDGPDWLTVINAMGEHRTWRLLPRPSTAT